MINKIKEHYKEYDENNRLIKDNSHKVEYLTTVYYFDKLFSNKKLKIFDPCAGTGRYSFYLADKGHDVWAADLSDHNVEKIKNNKKASKLSDIRECTVTNLSDFPDNVFDVTLCMGALYHIKDNEERKKAISECTRVTKKGGFVVLAYINRHGQIASSYEENLSNISDLGKVYEQTDEYLFTSTTIYEMAQMEKQCGLRTIHQIGVDGLSYIISDKLNNASDDDFKIWMNYHLLSCEDESIIGYSVHGLDICKKI